MIMIIYWVLAALLIIDPGSFKYIRRYSYISKINII